MRRQAPDPTLRHESRGRGARTAHHPGRKPAGRGPGIPIDITTGAISVAAIGFRRRWPADVGLLTGVTQVFSLSSGVAALIAVCTAGSYRRAATAIAIAVLHHLIWRPAYPFWVFWVVSMSEKVAALVFGTRKRRPPSRRWQTRLGWPSGSGSSARCMTSWRTGALEIRPGQEPDSVREAAATLPDRA